MRLWNRRPIVVVSSTVCFTLITTLSAAQQGAGFAQLASDQFTQLTPGDETLGWNSGSGSVEEHGEAALRWGHHILREISKEDQGLPWTEFNTMAEDAGFRVEEIIFNLARAYELGRADIDISRNETTARELYERAASMGHPASQHSLAAILSASGDPNEEVEAILNDFFAALGGDALAHATMGYRYLYGIGVVKNCVQSFKHYEVAAREVIRDMYKRGRGGWGRPMDRTRLTDRFVSGRRPASELDAERVEFWTSWAEGGDVYSNRNMGVLHLQGMRGVPQDLEAAFRYFKEASSQDSFSASMAGEMLMRGAGVEPDYQKALQFFRTTMDESISLNGLGYLYYHGLAVTEDMGQAYLYFLRAINKDKDNLSALFNLGMLYKEDKLGLKKGESLLVPLKSVEEGKTEMLEIKQDLAKARDYFMSAADQGHIEAAFHAAQLLAPRNASPDSEVYMLETCQKAVKYLKRVVERGPWMMGMQEAMDRISEGDYGGALVLYSRLGEIGVEVAQSNAAWLLESRQCTGAENTMGITARNGSSPEITCEKRALRMHEHAARQGLPVAEVRIGDFHYFGKAGFPVNYEKAVRRYQRASTARHPEALYSMGFMHQMGYGVKQDLNLAKRYFDDAATVDENAIPVARLALLWLYLHGAYMRWCNFWEAVWPATEADGGASGEQETSFLSNGEVYLMLGLMLLLMLVVLERQRRERRRLAEDDEGPAVAE